MTRHVKMWNGPYPEEDTGPLTDAERALLARRQELEHPDVGRLTFQRLPRDTEARHCVGLEGTPWELP
jgi:hypothetical protein